MLLVILMILLTGCARELSQKKGIMLSAIGKEGSLQNPENAYQLLDNTFLGVWSLSLSRAKLATVFPNSQEYYIEIQGEGYPLTVNEFNPALLEAALPDRFSTEEIRKGIVQPNTGGYTGETLPRAVLSIAAVVIDKDIAANGTTLYEIVANLFISMRNANVFVFTEAGTFIRPSYLQSSENNYYTVDVFISARNAAPDPSINGALLYLKSLSQHDSLLQYIYPNTARLVNKQVVIDPPQSWRRLRDLGPEGKLSLPTNVYNIIDNRSLLGVWSISFNKTRLPGQLKSGPSWKLTIQGTEYPFSQNTFDGDLHEVAIPDTVTGNIEEIRNSRFETGGSNNGIQFADPILEAAVRIADGYTGQATGSIYPEDVLGITILDVSGPSENPARADGDDPVYALRKKWRENPEVNRRGEAMEWPHGPNNAEEAKTRDVGGLVSLEGIQYLTNLVDLRFPNNQVNDLSPLQNLTNLEILVFGDWTGGNLVSDLTPLQNLSNLLQLAFANNQVTTLTPLQNLTSLQVLDFGHNQVTSLTPLQNLTNLWSLVFSNNQVTTLSPLQYLTNLQVLWFSNNQVTSLTPLQNLTNLQSLNFAGNQVTDLTPLQNLTKLSFLYFSETAVSDLAPLQNLTNLEDLYSCDNLVTNLTPLQNLTKLRVLALRSNAITDILPLVNNSGLGAGDYIGLQFNNLNLAPGSQNEQYINTLLSRGCDVIAEPQNPRFLMGNTRGESGTNADPVHEVLFTYPFSIEPYEVTFSDYDTYCDATGKSKPGDEGWGRDQRPVINVTWWDAIKYCNWMSIQENYPVAYDEITGSLLDATGNPTTDITKVKGYRLPTEAEWEYAARGGYADITNGVEANDYIYAGSNDLDEVGWYRDNSEWKTHPVGQKKANERVFFEDMFWTEGLFDMSGNVSEWCHDWWGAYPSSMQTNPIGPGSGSNRVYRGGSRGGNSEVCRVAFRDFMTPTHSNEDVGFRLARTVY